MVRTKEEIKEYNKDYYKKNREKILEYHKDYDENNKEKRKIYNKDYQENNKEKLLEKQKDYRKTEPYKKSSRISDWKRYGVKHEDFNSLYDYYLNVEFCEQCNVELVEGVLGANKKCLDHDHTTGEFRNVICQRCNIRRGFEDRKKI